MGSSFGSKVRVTIFGQSHSAAMGCVIEGLPVGFAIDEEALSAFMARRAPGRSPWSTPRKETDRVRILSGLNHQGRTCGAPLGLIIENTNTRSSDYSQLERVPRPGHADFPAWAKWQGEQDVPGGGHFSGRLTAPLCAAGGIALQMLEARGVKIAAHLAEAAGIADEPFAALNACDAARLSQQIAQLGDGRTFPVLDQDKGAAMVDAITAARDAQDSVGGMVECVALGLPAGLGEPKFDGIQSSIARIAFGIGAIKGVEFGAGFQAAELRGSQDNDPYELIDDTVIPRSNHAGGILGGLTTGAPLLFRLAVKPTSSISLEQDSVDLVEGQPARLVVHGRHDPCIAPRVVPVAEAICALVLLDAWEQDPPASPLPQKLGDHEHAEHAPSSHLESRD